jgi:hypothetical protein
LNQGDLRGQFAAETNNVIAPLLTELSNKNKKRKKNIRGRGKEV